jgi:hypothetical protein
MTVSCSNCGYTFSGNYCPSCSQKKNDGRIYFKDLWHDFLFYFMSLDAPLPRTVKELLIRPGKMIKGYINGKRKSYYSPVKFIILSIALYFIIASLLHFDPIYTETIARGEAPIQNYDTNNLTRTMYFLSNNINKFIFLFVIFLGLVSKLFFRKENYTITEYLAFGFFVIGMYMLLNIPIIIISFAFPQIIFIRYILLIYIIWALAQFQGKYNFSTLAKCFFTVLFSQLIYFVVVWIIAYYIILFTH